MFAPLAPVRARHGFAQIGAQEKIEQILDKAIVALRRRTYWATGIGLGSGEAVVCNWLPAKDLALFTTDADGRDDFNRVNEESDRLRKFIAEQVAAKAAVGLHSHRAV